MAFKPIDILIRAKDEASGVFSSLQAKVLAVGLAITTYLGVDFFSSAVKGAASFEAAMSRVEAATGATKEELVLLRAAAENVGPGFTSVQGAQALENLAKAGLNAKQAIEALPGVLALARAGDIELGQSAEIVTKVVMGLGLAFSETGRVADVLAKGANASNTSVLGLGQALSYAAPLANSLGLSLETTVAIIGKFADAGIDASRAGTALNSILAQFSDPASKFREELAAAGIITNNFETALRQLAAAGPRGSKAINAVGQEAGPALRALLNQGIGALDALKKQLDDSAGSAVATGLVMEKNLNGAIKGLASAWDGLKNVLGTPVLPVLKSGIEQLSGVLTKLVADGTVQKFGDAFAAAFEGAIKWVQEFIGQVDFTQVAADLRSFADRTGEVFNEIGESAKTASDSVKLAYGVMAAGTNTLLAGVYALGSGFGLVMQGMLKGLELLYTASAKVTFGDLSAQYKQMAADFKLGSDAIGAGVEALARKSEEQIAAVAKNAQLARDGYAGLTGAVEQSTTAVDTSAAAMARAAVELDRVAAAQAAVEASTVAAKNATDDKAAADAAAASALATLKAQYAELIASGNLQGAAEKLNEINKALLATPGAAKRAVDAAAEIRNAFTALGVTSTAEMKETAASFKTAYESIRDSGLATAGDLQRAFIAYAQKVIAANDGVAPSFLETEAAIRNVVLRTDEFGKTTAEAARKSSDAVNDVAKSYGDVETATRKTTSAIEDQISALERRNAAIERQNNALEKAAELERKRLNIDENGFSLDKQGGTLGQTVQTLTSIVNALKSYGLDQENAERIGRQFVGSDGKVPTNASYMQQKYAGPGGTLDYALQKAAEEYLYKQGGSMNPKTDTRAGVVHTVRIELPGSGTTSLNFATSNDADAAVALFRRLGADKARAS